MINYGYFDKVEILEYLCSLKACWQHWVFGPPRDEQANQQTNKRTKKQTNEETNERMNERMNERTNGLNGFYIIQDHNILVLIDDFSKALKLYWLK